MDTLRKLTVLADAAKYDASCASSGAPRRHSADQLGIGSAGGMGICHSYAPDGRCISLLKILLTNWCTYDCLYCVNRQSSNVGRARFRIDEVVELTLDFYRRNLIEGLFLSSGIIQSPDYTMEQTIEVARRLREQHHFRGYIHLKTIPDASSELVARAGLFADRLSINVELPTAAALARLAPEKDAGAIKRSMARIRLALDDDAQERRNNRAPRAAAQRPPARPQPPRFAPAGQSTQMIVGADDASDRTVLTASAALYRNYRLRRVYYSAFSPIPHASAALPSSPAPLLREHRLYQADWLVRFYGFDHEELASADDGMLSLEHDPKLAWALAHPEVFPLDLNRAPREQLLRVPGLGVRSVERVLASRRVRSLHRADVLRLQGATRRVLAFVHLPDHRPPATARALALALQPARRAAAAAQLDLFDAATPRLSAVQTVTLHRPHDADAVLDVLRGLVDAGVAAADVRWTVADGRNDMQAELFSAELPSQAPRAANATAWPPPFVALARCTLMHDEPQRLVHLHALAARLHADARAWFDELDADRIALERLAGAVRREIHKMHAFVRFRPVADEQGQVRHLAFFEPAHDVLRAAAPFFEKRFAAMPWAILTPRGSVAWDRRSLTFGPPAAASDLPGHGTADDGDRLWLAYYRSIFNPARIKVAAMQREMPLRFWKHLPEARAIAPLLAAAPARVRAMVEHQDAPAAVRANPHADAPAPNLETLQRQAASCEDCAFAAQATQTVWGEGAPGATLMLVGEQPGDREDLAGRPFVGPAGVLLRGALAELGWPLERLYLTNAVKHFKYEWRGKRRLHKTAAQREAQSCERWLTAEIDAIGPQAFIALGATAARALLGRSVEVLAEEGRWLDRADGRRVLVVRHPSALLRADAALLPRAYAAWLRALGTATRLLGR